MYDVHQCGCFSCRIAHSRARENNAQGKINDDGYRIPNVGTQRRLRALNAIGHTWTSIGERLGMRVPPVRELAGVAKTHPYTKCFPETAEKVKQLYEELWDVHPTGTAAHRARLSAKRKGYLPPAAWDDDTIDDPDAEPASPEDDVIDVVVIKRALDGLPVEMTHKEMDAAITTLINQGATSTMITKRLSVGKERVKRVRRLVA